MKRLLSFLFISGLLSANAFAYEKQCVTFEPPLSGGFCIHTPTDVLPSFNVVYYLHGKNGSEHTWSSDQFFGEQIREQWQETALFMPTVVSISFGPIWLLAEKNESPVSGLFEIMTQQVIPQVEKLIEMPIYNRIILGDSMGAFNGMQLALKTDLFDKAALVCAPISGLSPFSDEKQITEYIEGSKAWQYFKNYMPELVIKSVNEGIKISQGFFPTPAAWAKGDPMELVKYSTSYHTRFYISSGFYDEYASYDANVALADKLKEYGFRAHFRPTWGGHCAVDIPSLATYLAW